MDARRLRLAEDSVSTGEFIMKVYQRSSLSQCRIMERQLISRREALTYGWTA